MTIILNKTREAFLAGWCVLVLTVAWISTNGCDHMRWTTVRVRNLSDLTLTDVRLVEIDPEVAFGFCPPDADVSSSLADRIMFQPNVSIEYSIAGQAYRQMLDKHAAFPSKLPSPDNIIELQFTTNRVWTWTLKQGRVME